MRRRLPLFVAAVLTTVSVATSALTIVTPNDLSSSEGNSNNCYPFACGAQRYQQVYDASLFGGTSGIVDAILFRLDHGSTSFSATYDVEIRLSNTTTSAATMSATFANNVGTDQTLVLQDSAYAVSGMGTIGPSPNPFLCLDGKTRRMNSCTIRLRQAPGRE